MIKRATAGKENLWTMINYCSFVTVLKEANKFVFIVNQKIR